MTWNQVRERLNDWATVSKSEWAGAPLPISTTSLVVEPRYPFQGLNGVSFGDDEPSDEAMERAALLDFEASGKVYPINSWMTAKGQVIVYHTGNSRSKVAVLPHTVDEKCQIEIQSYVPFAEGAWSLKAEMTALHKMRDLVGDYKFAQYMITGMILEKSQRSGVFYLFRRLRPTIAMRETNTGRLKLLSTLCLHPIGYYKDTYAGVMVPTDDVIAHIALMRGDEYQFWKQANHGSL